MPILRYHPKLYEIIHNLDYSKIGSQKQPSGWYSSATHPGYAGDTIFEGCGSTDDLWISVNIIENYNDLFLHTSLPLSPSAPVKNIISSIPGLNTLSNTTLINVGALKLGVPQLVQSIENNIFPYI